jgi:alkaline phosphatase
MRKRFSILLVLAFIAVSVMAEGKAKYVFYFIGDGMGVNQVNAAETYLGALEGKIGIKELCFPSFPYSAMVNTQSGTNGVTDSAAGGTALATGCKSHNGTIGMLSDKETPVTSIAKWAHDKGAAVGVATTVSVDNATPAAFYAHVPSRGQTYNIGVQLASSGYDFFAGSDFVTPDNPSKGGDNLYQQAEKAGYTIAKGYKDYQKKAKKADKMILFQTDEANKQDRSEIPYACDRAKSDLTISEITRAAINFLTKKQGEKDGFFLMVEGGKIDHACHANDPAAFIKELIDMDDAVKVAYEFYQQHPDETLIIVTADHETGGMVLGRGAYELHLDLLRYANMSISKLGKELHKLHAKYGDKYSVDIVKKFLKDNFGLWDKVKLDEGQSKRIETAFNDIMAGKGKDEHSLYQKDDELASTVRKILNEVSGISWASYGHSNGYVPVFAVGVGAEQFGGRIDNTEIPRRAAKAAGWEQQ